VNTRAEISLEAQTGMSNDLKERKIGAGFGAELPGNVCEQIFGPFVVPPEARLDLRRIDVLDFCDWI
jgi:hypothetical protein